ncbi:MAG: SDR family oxidoreductase [Alphaproteobacteria bacterium]
MHLVCFGLGYVGAHLARALVADGWQVTGTVRDPARAAALSGPGLAMLAYDGATVGEALAARLAAATHLLGSIPPDEAAGGEDTGGDPALRALAAAGTPPRLAWAGYLSTTGVYGDTGGAWVDEDSPAAPADAKAAARLAAEAAWRRWQAHSGIALDILRLAGIYGPGRSALDAVREGRARRIVKPGQVFSRIHVDDIVAAVRACIARPDGLRVFNVCDDEPAPPQDVTAFACALAGVAPPAEEPFETAALGPAARRFYAANRRVSSARIKAALGLAWRHPTYRSGLQALALADHANR